ncbi:MAG: HAD family hydrolase [Proteobacteria bacterium]|nr:MAG: HAD family hydrolase [Pseudomonadota bacterium]QKK10730.1 MAG: HAD-IA family hydrolase [Pseudomonadota bacterium]
MSSEKKHTLDAVIWDMGGIMYRFFTELMVDVGKERGWPLDRLPLGPTGPGPDPYYAAMDRGEISEPDYVVHIVEALAAESIAFSPYTDLDFSRGERPATWRAIEHLQQAGWKQALLTNDATAWLGERWWESWEHAHLFDAVVDVKSVGVRKPAPEPYLACAEALNRSPQSCLFVDDMRANCAGAEAVGMQSFWFDITDPQTALAALLRRLTT